MVKYREILRLSALGISQENVAYSVGCAQSTVSDVLANARVRGLAWPLPEEMDDRAIRAVLYPPRPSKGSRHPIDFERVAAGMRRKGTTMRLLWSEYCEAALAAGSEPYMYSAFCKEYKDWSQSEAVSMHVEHAPAQVIQVDWVGDTGRVVDPDTGEVSKVYVFAACLPYSSRIFARGYLSMGEQSWIDAHVAMFADFGGSTPILTPDNTKTAVVKNTKEDLVLNEAYREMSEHYRCAVIPARVRRPRDKGAIEMNVGVIERQALAAMRDRTYFSLDDFNADLADLVAAINARPFQKREGSRESVFLAEEKPLLAPLPPRPYELVARKECTVNFNYHVCFDGAWYSVPSRLVKSQVSVRATGTSVTISADGARVAVHPRTYRKGAYVTDPDHMPRGHREYGQWSGERFLRAAEKVGGAVRSVMQAILDSHPIEQQAYRSCQGLLSLEKRCGADVLAEACEKALLCSARPSYKTVKDIAAALGAQGGEGEDVGAGAYLRDGEYYRRAGDEERE